MTYRQAYQEFLETALATGGTPGQMKTAADEYNAVGNPDYLATKEFGEFLRASTFDCTSCGNGFELDEVESGTQARLKRLLDRETECEDCGP